MSLLTLAKPVKVEKKVSSNTGSENPAGGRGGTWDAIAPPEKSGLFLYKLQAAHQLPQTSFLWKQAPSVISKL